jgi:RNA polymerase sigma-70 factor, ECF subfamily
MVGGDTRADAVLVALAQRKDSTAFETLIERYQALVSAYTRQLLENIPEAEDVAQEIFLIAFQEVHTLREAERFGAWLKSIAWRECRGWVRRQQAARRAAKLAESPPMFADPILEEAADEDDPWLKRLEQTIEALGEGRQTVLALFYLRGLSHEMIADFLEIPIGTIKRRLFEARQALAASTGAADDMDLAERRRFVETFKRLLQRATEKKGPT